MGAGYAVAATYHGNDEAAAKFKAETGASTFKWDVADPAGHDVAAVREIRDDVERRVLALLGELQLLDPAEARA